MRGAALDGEVDACWGWFGGVARRRGEVAAPEAGAGVEPVAVGGEGEVVGGVGGEGPGRASVGVGGLALGEGVTGFPGGDLRGLEVREGGGDGGLKRGVVGWRGG